MAILVNSLKKIQTKYKDNGVITESDLPANTPILEFKGRIYRGTLPDNLNQDYILQIGKEIYIGRSGNLDDYINHSCNPNCYVYSIGTRAFLYTINAIPKNTEITYDYSVTSTNEENDWSMDCKCKSYNCRKKISGFKYLPDEVKLKYKTLGIIPKFLLK